MLLALLPASAGEDVEYVGGRAPELSAATACTFFCQISWAQNGRRTCLHDMMLPGRVAAEVDSFLPTTTKAIRNEKDVFCWRSLFKSISSKQRWADSFVSIQCELSALLPTRVPCMLEILRLDLIPLAVASVAVSHGQQIH